MIAIKKSLAYFTRGSIWEFLLVIGTDIELLSTGAF